MFGLDLRPGPHYGEGEWDGINQLVPTQLC